MEMENGNGNGNRCGKLNYVPDGTTAYSATNSEAELTPYANVE